jgi:hypothetical protein
MRHEASASLRRVDRSHALVEPAIVLADGTEAQDWRIAVDRARLHPRVAPSVARTALADGCIAWVSGAGKRTATATTDPRDRDVLLKLRFRCDAFVLERYGQARPTHLHIGAFPVSDIPTQQRKVIPRRHTAGRQAGSPPHGKQTHSS